MLTFAAIARAGGVRGAASALGTPRSTVSRHLARLEEAVGAPLVVRTSRRFALTELGRELARRCEQLEEFLRASEELVHQASEEPSGVLRLAVAPILGEELLPSVLAEYLRRYPRVQVDMHLSVDYVDLRRGTDLALRSGPLEDATDLFATRLGTSVVGHYVSPAYARTRGVPATPSELSGHDCIHVGRATPASWLFRSGGREQRITVTPRLRVDSFRLARSVAVEGLGILRTATFFAAPLVASGELVPVLERWWPHLPVHAIHSSGSPPPPKIRAFLELLREAVRPHLAEPAGGE